jgi:hypothetical protein
MREMGYFPVERAAVMQFGPTLGGDVASQEEYGEVEIAMRLEAVW